MSGNCAEGFCTSPVLRRHMAVEGYLETEPPATAPTTSAMAFLVLSVGCACFCVGALAGGVAFSIVSRKAKMRSSIVHGDEGEVVVL